MRRHASERHSSPFTRNRAAICNDTTTGGCCVRSVIYVVRQPGHDARLTLSRYGHVIDELDEQPRIDAETAIQEARVPSQFPNAPGNAPNPDSRTPETRVEAANSGRWS